MTQLFHWFLFKRNSFLLLYLLGMTSELFFFGVEIRLWMDVVFLRQGSGAEPSRKAVSFPAHQSCSAEAVESGRRALDWLEKERGPDSEPIQFWIAPLRGCQDLRSLSSSYDRA